MGGGHRAEARVLGCLCIRGKPHVRDIPDFPKQSGPSFGNLRHIRNMAGVVIDVGLMFLNLRKMGMSSWS